MPPDGRRDAGHRAREAPVLQSAEHEARAGGDIQHRVHAVEVGERGDGGRQSPVHGALVVGGGAVVEAFADGPEMLVIGHPGQRTGNRRRGGNVAAAGSTRKNRPPRTGNAVQLPAPCGSACHPVA